MVLIMVLAWCSCEVYKEEGPSGDTIHGQPPTSGEAGLGGHLSSAWGECLRLESYPGGHHERLLHFQHCLL